eukprot:562702-Amorphochlora_amoeboformis.AAC.1
MVDDIIRLLTGIIRELPTVLAPDGQSTSKPNDQGPLLRRWLQPSKSLPEHRATQKSSHLVPSYMKRTEIDRVRGPPGSGCAPNDRTPRPACRS